MNKKTYLFISSSIFALVATLHLIRIFNQTPVMFGTWVVPMAVSWIGFIVAAFLSCLGFVLMTQETK